MGDFAKQRATAACWMYDRKDRPVDWWRWTVLTVHNSDSKTLKLDNLTAFLIFADLVHDGLLVPIVASDGHEAYSINPGKDAEWEMAMHPRFSLFKSYGLTILGWAISAVVGGVVTKLVGL